MCVCVCVCVCMWECTCMCVYVGVWVGVSPTGFSWVRVSFRVLCLLPRLAFSPVCMLARARVCVGHRPRTHMRARARAHRRARRLWLAASPSPFALAIVVAAAVVAAVVAAATVSAAAVSLPTPPAWSLLLELVARRLLDRLWRQQRTRQAQAASSGHRYRQQ
eukprot:COSAG05_NODE_1229_length_5448_cov_26.241167_3_plen_163_part_00